MKELEKNLSIEGQNTANLSSDQRDSEIEKLLKRRAPKLGTAKNNPDIALKEFAKIANKKEEHKDESS